MTSFTLKIIALITMFIDHLGYAIFNKFSFFNYIGRVAFPIFAFQISEGFHYTKNVKKYFDAARSYLKSNNEKLIFKYKCYF